MIVDDVQARLLKPKDIDQTFAMAKDCLFEKGIEVIKDDILITGLKNAMAKPYRYVDVGLFKLNTLVGFAFLEINGFWYEELKGKLNTIYLIPSMRTKQNYQKLWDFVATQLTMRDIKKIITADNWTLVNDCEIFTEWLEDHAKRLDTFEVRL